ncbi:hypothetical protein GCM10027515_17740 [Schumannella luteola]|uniref:Uncharacterized protein n=1 Tax=Schumannella luteola TaxID=472059 RepID=A0A852YMM0_9MICO|nr:hypothetical protein [Schumannella luteola]NYH00429.1 hypothetical protein [Schumannella luteola]TPX03659.1 hypothetical protein FJ656_15920 [Schumannella luteola]
MPTTSPTTPSASPTTPAPTACEQLARVADRLAERTGDPRRFLRGLAWNCAGVRLDPRGLFDLARGGRNRFHGGGFRAEFDDGTTGQVRHFAGIAVAPVLIGERATRWAMRTVLRDPETSADHRLSLAALEFARELRSGGLPIRAAGDWIRERLAASGA